MSEPEKKDDYCPRMSGNTTAYQPQWKHRGAFGEAINKKHLGLEGGDKWTNVPFVTLRNGMGIKLADGTTVPLGVPFPRIFPGIYETIHLCGYEQAMALAWSFAAWVASAGGEIDVRAEEYELIYELKARLMPEKK